MLDQLDWFVNQHSFDDSGTPSAARFLRVSEDNSHHPRRCSGSDPDNSLDPTSPALRRHTPHRPVSGSLNTAPQIQEVPVCPTYLKCLMYKRSNANFQMTPPHEPLQTRSSQLRVCVRHRQRVSLVEAMTTDEKNYLHAV